MDIEKLLENMRIYAHKNYVPIIRDESAKLLQQQIKENKPKKILEIGTAIGYSGILMLLSNANSHLTTIEKDEKRFVLAKENFEKAGFFDRTSQIFGDAQTILENLVENKETFDFIFLDGPKGQYIRYFPLLEKLLKINGLLFADNVLFDGLVEFEGAIPHKKRTMVYNLRKFLDAIKTSQNFETQVLEVEDGVALCKKIK